jgi:hypothetical protein
MRTPLNTVAVLDRITVAVPCPVSWAAMHGDDQVRFCAQCRQHVYNLSEMTADQATQLLEAKQGRLCVQLVRDRDGTLLTADRAVGWRWRIFKHLRRRRMAWAASLFALVFLSGCPMGGGNLRPMPREALAAQDSSASKDPGGTATLPSPK